MTSGGTGARPESGGAPQGLTRQAIGGMAWTFSGTGVQVAVQFLAIMALGRLLTPAEFGLMAAANVIVGFSQIVSQVGVGPAIIQRQTLRPRTYAWPSPSPLSSDRCSASWCTSRRRRSPPSTGFPPSSRCCGQSPSCFRSTR